ncbi:MAG: aspartate kinase [Tatlockia sp.]|jgi:aspartate kinase
MALLVQKFGGTSLRSVEHINHAADLVAKAKQAGHQVVVIVSAMSGETDKLIALAHQLSPCPEPREFAALLATGEQVTMALMAIALINKGISARSYTGTQARIETCSRFKNARIQYIDTKPILADLNADNVVVIAGFQGVDAQGNITTLGRGGSDTTAVALAAALKADECQIFTDVDGVYTTDPRIVPDARRLEQVTFEEMLELSSLGAKVLQIRAVEFAGKYNVPLRVLSSSKEGPGTLISYQKKNPMESSLVTGIAASRNEVKVTLDGVPNLPGIISTILAELNKLDVSMDMIAQHLSADNKTNFTFTIHTDIYHSELNKIQNLVNVVNASQVISVINLAKLSLVGLGLKSHPQITSMLVNALDAQGIAIQLIASSEIRISVLIEDALLEKGIIALHRVFKLENLAEHMKWHRS